MSGCRGVSRFCVGESGGVKKPKESSQRAQPEPWSPLPHPPSPPTTSTFASMSTSTCAERRTAQIHTLRRVPSASQVSAAMRATNTPISTSISWNHHLWPWGICVWRCTYTLRLRTVALPHPVSCGAVWYTYIYIYIYLHIFIVCLSVSV